MNFSSSEKPAAPIADSFRVAFCGSCPNAHILYLDKDKNPIAQATMSLDQALELVTRIVVQR